MRIAYADPPYLGCCSLYDHDHGSDGRCWDDVETHARLLERLQRDYPDGWALSLHEPSLRHILPLAPEGTRTAAWVKPFASFKPGVNPAYTWEPVLWLGGRCRDRSEPTVRDHCIANIALRKGLTGAKPPAFWYWLFDLLGLRAGDEFVDLFKGTGGGDEAWQRWSAQTRMRLVPGTGQPPQSARKNW